MASIVTNCFLGDEFVAVHVLSKDLLNFESSFIKWWLRPWSIEDFCEHLDLHCLANNIAIE